VFKYLLSQGVDEMTYVVPSLSLMLDAEADFDEDNPADYPSSLSVTSSCRRGCQRRSRPRR